jgi:hypothetical protein
VVLPNATIGEHRVQPVLQGGREADQSGPVTQQDPQIPDLLGGDPGLRQQIRPQQLGQGRRIDRAAAIALQRLGWTRCGSSSNSSSRSTSQPQP